MIRHPIDARGNLRIPMEPAGTILMDGEQSAFYHMARYNRQVALNREKASDPVGPHQAAAVEWGHTGRRESRRDGDYLVLNQDAPVRGTAGHTAMPSGSFPGGTTQVGHFHPGPEGVENSQAYWTKQGVPPGLIPLYRAVTRDRHKFPSGADYLSHYETETNALQRPGTDIQAEMMIDATDLSAYLYSGRLDAEGKPRFFRAIPHPVFLSAPPMEYVKEAKIPYVPNAGLIVEIAALAKPPRAVLAPPRPKPMARL